MLKSGSSTHSTAASTTGRYSGRQPAITALAATFSTVASPFSGSTSPSTSVGARSVKASACFTRATVGGTTGRPSLQPRRRNSSCSRSSARGPRITSMRWRGKSAASGTLAEQAPARPRAASACRRSSRRQPAGPWEARSRGCRLTHRPHSPGLRAASSASPAAASRSWSSGSPACRCARTDSSSSAAGRRDTAIMMCSGLVTTGTSRLGSLPAKTLGICRACTQSFSVRLPGTRLVQPRGTSRTDAPACAHARRASSGRPAWSWSWRASRRSAGSAPAAAARCRSPCRP